MIYINAFQRVKIICPRIKYDHFFFLIFFTFQLVKLLTHQIVSLRLNAAPSGCENYSSAAANKILLMS